MDTADKMPALAAQTGSAARPEPRLPTSPAAEWLVPSPRARRRPESPPERLAAYLKALDL
ncbi:MAG TPA: hypothetical protein VFL04_09115 [Rectinemataceae bacterium]|nr:hypothetical protein [Rectinemataceae bacterium]